MNATVGSALLLLNPQEQRNLYWENAFSGAKVQHGGLICWLQQNWPSVA